mmetsp:Transcript_363/g.831  ORF Transcript_363/g.831 Transcript_363/m.831 type:complete len:120 (-) Transcript_363:773-1132(-)
MEVGGTGELWRQPEGRQAKNQCVSLTLCLSVLRFVVCLFHYLEDGWEERELCKSGRKEGRKEMKREAGPRGRSVDEAGKFKKRGSKKEYGRKSNRKNSRKERPHVICTQKVTFHRQKKV